jgi:nucleobase:cation symporter-1, NCS1 family
MGGIATNGSESAQVLPPEEAFKVELRGIDYIPAAERRGKPSDLFWMWTGTLVNIGYVVYGAVIISLGLSLVQAAVVILVGNLTYVLLGLTSLQGPQAGTSVFVISRAAFGHRGGQSVSVLNWLTQVGFEIEGLALATLAAIAIVVKAGGSAGTGLKIVLILAIAAAQLILPLFGHATILQVLKWLTLPFFVLFVILAILAGPKLHLSAHPGASFATVAIAFAIVFSVTGLGWNYNGSDYTRYLPKDTSQRAIFGWVTLGGILPSTLMMFLGAFVATAVPAASDPISGLPAVFGAWFLIPYLVVIIFQLLAGNCVVLYSSCLTLQAIGLKVKRWQAALIDTTFCAALTAVTVFSNKFNTLLGDFLLFIIVWAAPWGAIYLVDWALRRGRYRSADLLVQRGGLYWRDNGWNIPAVVAQILGMGAALLAIDTSVFVGPLSRAAGGADFSAFMGLAVGGAAYYVLARARVAREVGAPVTAPAVAASHTTGSVSPADPGVS